MYSWRWRSRSCCSAALPSSSSTHTATPGARRSGGAVFSALGLFDGRHFPEPADVGDERVEDPLGVNLGVNPGAHKRVPTSAGQQPGVRHRVGVVGAEAGEPQLGFPRGDEVVAGGAQLVDQPQRVGLLLLDVPAGELCETAAMLLDVRGLVAERLVEIAPERGVLDLQLADALPERRLGRLGPRALGVVREPCGERVGVRGIRVREPGPRLARSTRRRPR